MIILGDNKPVMSHITISIFTAAVPLKYICSLAARKCYLIAISIKLTALQRLDLLKGLAVAFVVRECYLCFSDRLTV